MAIVNIKTVQTNIKNTDQKITYKIKKYVGDEMKIAAEIIIKNRLYVNGWNLRGMALEVLNNSFLPRENADTKAIFVAYDMNDKPIGIGMCHPSYHGVSNNVNFYVKKDFRRIGIGMELANAMKRFSKKTNRGVRGAQGTIESPKFFSKCGIYCELI